MNPLWFGDSFDLVKRFFVESLSNAGYHVMVDPMLTGEWEGLEESFYKLLKASPVSSSKNGKTALLLDPDTGIGKKATSQHVTISDIATQLQSHDIVVSFDQSFSRAGSATDKIIEKLTDIHKTGNFAFYYDSHARFMFAANSAIHLNAIEQQLLVTGLPKSRLVKLNNT